ncbi:hypothetical protein RJT34_23125 [Clitoria ternatea]|uniref:Coenzyme Q-binding protein COQ10 START domain-containing protein n=1 Tax=Clitoria ternatea TaxID=43366 RepID=A0AAN9FRI0_CLITE
MRAFPASTESHSSFLFPQPRLPSITITHSPLLFFHPFHFKSLSTPKPFTPFLYTASKSNPATMNDDDGDFLVAEDDDVSEDSLAEDGVYIEVTKLEKNSRRIQSSISIEAPLSTIWTILTDYERLADFIPGLAVSQLLQKGDRFARLLQVPFYRSSFAPNGDLKIGQQNLAFGIKFNAKGVVDCYEKELETLPSGMKREIEFKMIEGDFQLFEGKWSILQQSKVEEVSTILSYIVDVKPKLWLPIRLIEGRLCNEIKMNLASIRDEAHKVIDRTLHIHQLE